MKDKSNFLRTFLLLLSIILFIAGIVSFNLEKEIFVFLFSLSILFFFSFIFKLENFLDGFFFIIINIVGLIGFFLLFGKNLYINKNFVIPYINYEISFYFISFNILIYISLYSNKKYIENLFSNLEEKIQNFLEEREIILENEKKTQKQKEKEINQKEKTFNSQLLEKDRLPLIAHHSFLFLFSSILLIYNIFTPFFIDLENFSLTRFWQEGFFFNVYILFFCLKISNNKLNSRYIFKGKISIIKTFISYFLYLALSFTILLSIYNLVFLDFNIIYFAYNIIMFLVSIYMVYLIYETNNEK